MFADRLQNSIEKRKSFLVVGFDPQLETFPKFILDEAASQGETEEESIFLALTHYYALATGALSDIAAAIKPNIAFFEQYGLGGLRAFSYVCALCKDHGLPCIIDAKRGDIGHTAKAYSSAFLGKSSAFEKRSSILDGDALTVNPFLGFDTLQPFLDDCKEYGKGIFILVKTSNPGSGDIQDLKDSSNTSISERVAGWIGEHAHELQGVCGFSGLGAVVGATYPDQARALRKLMPDSFLLIPGLGSQGGSAQDARAGFAVREGQPQSEFRNPGGAVVNVSRGVFQGGDDTQSFLNSISEKAHGFREALNC